MKHCSKKIISRTAAIVWGMVLAISFTGCYEGREAGGPLPTLVTEWTEEPSRSLSPSAADLPEDTAFHVAPDPAGIGDDIPVSRALTAKMLALTYFDLSTIHSLDYEITFTDVSPESWYAKYINAACARGLMTGADGVFLPDEPLTLSQAHTLLLKLDPLHKPGITLSDDNKNRPVSYALWVELYKKMLEDASGDMTIYEAFGVESASAIVLATSGNNPSLSGGQMIADTGAFTHEGLNLDAYVDKGIRVLHRNREIIALTMLTDESPTIQNAFIVEADGDGLHIFCGGANRYYTYAQECAPVEADAAGLVCDLQVSTGEAVSVQIARETKTGILLKSTNDALEFKEWGVIPLASGFKTYASIPGSAVKWKNYVNLLVGTNMATYFIRDGMVCAAVITQNITPENIRVNIGTAGFAGLVHKSVSVTSAGAFTVTAGDTEKEYGAGKRFTVSDIENTELFGQERVYIRCKEPGGTLQLVGLSRNWPDGVSPRYRGVIEISRESGGYLIVNELPIEEYLYAVVPSEMPSSYGVEVSKVQAVTARSYAYNQLFENRFHAYGGNVDDSVSCQVYNNIPENETSITAVDGTRGQCLTYNGGVITANFFSTSCGMTANSGEVWATAGMFPGTTGAYLTAKPQNESANFGNLADEETAASFFKNTGIEAYDSKFNWFRWQVRMTAEELSASINANLRERYNASPSLIKTQQTAANGQTLFLSRQIESIGNLTDMKITKRGTGGNIMELLLVGSEAAVLVKTEYNIRMLLKPVQYLDNGRDITLTRADGSSVNNYSLMPSAFFTFDLETDENGLLTAVAFYGGGNGHGVGMSQNGVKGMIDRGFSFEDALSHYYPGTEIKKMY